MNLHHITATKLSYWSISILLTLASQTASAGLIFTDRVSFEAAALGTLVATEDFESFALGTVSNPLAIMGGSAEIFDTRPNIEIISNTVGGPSPSQAWLGNVSSNSIVTMQGLGGTSLGLTAIGFDFGQQFDGQWSFVHSGGIDLSTLVPAGSPELNKFIGWVSDGSEVLSFATSSNGGIIVDNVAGYASAPEPSILALMGLGLAGFGFSARKKKTA